VRSAFALFAFIGVTLLSLNVRWSTPLNLDRPSFPEFLNDVHDATPRGATIVVIVPTPRGDVDATYARYRASYFLAGRQVLPATVRDADFIAAWHEHVQTNRPLIWQRHGGELLGR